MRPEAAASALLDRFLPGWVAGGPAPVVLPLGAAALRAAALRVREGRVPPQVAVERAARASELLPLGGPMALGEAELPLLVLVYNLLALGHPALARVDARLFERPAALRFTARLALSLRPPRDAREALGAHTLVGPLFEAEREDTTVTFWAGERRYEGCAPPRHMLTLPWLRRVRVSRSRQRVAGALPPAVGPVLSGRLLLASPLTDLATAGRPAPPFAFGGTVRWLADPDLARGLRRIWLATSARAEVGGTLVRAALARIRGGAPREEALLLLGVLYGLHVHHNLETMQWEARTPTADPVEAPARTEAARLWLALFKVLAPGAEVFGLPGEAELGEALAKRLRAWGAALSALDTREEEARILAVLREHLNLLGYPGGAAAAAPAV